MSGETLTKLVVQLEAQNAQFIKELQHTRREIQGWKSQAQGSLDAVAKSSVKSSAAVGSGFRLMRGASTQFGYQIQDIAVQLQSGQNALLVFGQQGSQIASIFGPGGAVLGAVLAVSAALGTALLPQLFDSSDATEDLTKKIKDLNKEYHTLGAAQRGVLTNEQTTSIEEQNKIIEDSREKIARLTAAQEALAQSQNTSLTGLARFAPAFGDLYTGLEKAAEGAAESQVDFAAEIETANQAILRAEQTIKDLESGYKDRQANVDNMIASLAKEAATYGYTATQMALYEAGLAGANKEELERIATLRAMIDAQDALKNSVEDTADAEQKKIRDAQFKQVDDIMRVGIGGFNNPTMGTSEEAEKLTSIDQKMGELLIIYRNGNPVLV